MTSTMTPRPARVEGSLASADEAGSRTVLLVSEAGSGSAVDRLLALRLHRREDGKRSPHKPLLVLLALGRLSETGSSAVPWSIAEERLADLLEEFGPPSRSGRAQSAAYPFTRLRSDAVWELDAPVPMDGVRALRDADPVGRLTGEVEGELRSRPGSLAEVARALVTEHFPPSIAPDVLLAAGLDPDILYTSTTAVATRARARSAAWRREILLAWDRQCAFCGFDGQFGSATVAVEAAHVRWFSHGGPDELDNGLALCSLHHKLFDCGALGLSADHRVRVSALYTARTDTGRAVKELHDRPLSSDAQRLLPAARHVAWHSDEVFKAGPARCNA